MDIIQTFTLDNYLFKGSFISADQTVNAIWNKHDYPKELKSIFAQSLLIALALSAGIKYQGVFSLQIKGDGPVSSLFIDVTTDQKVRGYMTFRSENENWENKSTIKELFGNGQLIFSVVALGQEPYQGIVALTHDNLSETVKDYFRLSEQIETELILRQQNDQTRCLLLQKMPDKKEVAAEESADLWETVTVLMNSIRDDELFSGSLTPNDILYRLFHEHAVMVFDPKTPVAECRCYRGKMETFLKRMKPEERVNLYNDKGEIETVCQFCGEKYTFSKTDLGDN